MVSSRCASAAACSASLRCPRIARLKARCSTSGVYSISYINHSGMPFLLCRPAGQHSRHCVFIFAVRSKDSMQPPLCGALCSLSAVSRSPQIGAGVVIVGGRVRVDVAVGVDVHHSRRRGRPPRPNVHRYIRLHTTKRIAPFCAMPCTCT